MLLDGDYRQYIKATKEKFYAGELDSKMAIYKSIKKPLEDYGTLPPHVRAASMVEGGIRIGDKVGYLKVGENKTDILVVEDGKINIKPQQRKYVWEHMFKSLIDRFSVPVNMTLSSFWEKQ
jgi:DNA polymerase elongation subunit (family B)